MIAFTRPSARFSRLPTAGLGIMGRVLRLTIDALAPPRCGACDNAVANPNALCARCWSKLQFITEPLCPIYGTPFVSDLGAGLVSAAALADPPPFRSARSALVYNEIARHLVHALKYRDQTYLAKLMATFMAGVGGSLLTKTDLLVPVPLHPRRLLARRYNQAALIADRLAKHYERPHDPMALTRLRDTAFQAGFGLAKRQRNVRGAFRVHISRENVVAGREILLIDDVYTSGATAHAAARALIRAGAAAVDVLTFARVLKE